MDVPISGFVFKALSVCSIFLCSLFFGIAPIFCKKCVKSKKVQWVNRGIISFSGGTLIGVSFLHLMPEMRNSVSGLLDQGYFKSFPRHVSLADTITGCGFFLLYVLDELVHLLLQWVGEGNYHQPHGQKEADHDSLNLLQDGDTHKAEERKETKEVQTATDVAEVEVSSAEAEVTEEEEVMVRVGRNIHVTANLCTQLISKLLSLNTIREAGQEVQTPADGAEGVKEEVRLRDGGNSYVLIFLSILGEASFSGFDGLIVSNATERHPLFHIPSVITIIALSFHDIFEGLTLGIQAHMCFSPRDVMFLYLSIMTHKYAIAFAVSLDLLLSGVKDSMILIYTVCFSIGNPLGICIGIATVIIGREDPKAESPMTVLMQGLASGSLIYVTCFEVLQRHTPFEDHVSGLRNTFFVIAGFTFILTMKMYLPLNISFYEHPRRNSTEN